MDIHFDNKLAINLLWIVPALLVVYFYSFYRKRRAMESFATSNLLIHLVPQVNLARQKFKALLILLALGSLAIALTGPRWGVHYEEIHQRGIDIFFCLDVSRSMLAEDVSPSRLERAKQYISDVVEQLHGDRVGLVTFAGNAVLKCPLTVDYGTFRMVLDDVGVRSSSRGGTLIGDALRMAADSFADKVKKYKAIMVVTDGEDHESYPVEAAGSVYSEQGIRVYTVGLGDLNEGSRIPVTRNGQRVYLQHDGEEVWSKLDTETLLKMALTGGGAYIPAGVNQVDMGRIYREKIATEDLREFGSSRTKRYDSQYQWFTGLAFVLLMIESLMADHGRRKMTDQSVLETTR